jgi:hypothetical protein
MAPHRAKQQRNRSNLPEALVSGNINVCRTMAIRTTVVPYSRHGFILISRSFRAWDRSGGHRQTSLSGISNQFWGAFSMAQRGRGNREPMQPSLREDQSRLGTAHLQYSQRRQSQARLFTATLASLGVLGWEVSESWQPNLCNLNALDKLPQ